MNSQYKQFVLQDGGDAKEYENIGNIAKLQFCQFS